MHLRPKLSWNQKGEGAHIMELTKLVLIFLVGIVSGFLNVNAGGGSLISMPILIFLGLPSAVANGTNRVALMAQNLVAISNFKKNGYFDLKLNLILAIPALLGSIVGSNLAISLPDQLFNTILAMVMILVLVFTFKKPKIRVDLGDNELTLKHKIIGGIAFFFVGVYGGFIQAGIGLVIITILNMMTGYSLARINSMKVFIVAFYMAVSLAVFLLNGKVDWIIGLNLALGNGIGGYLGSSFSIKKGDKWIKIIMVIAVALMAAKLLGLFDLIISLLG